MSSITKTLSRAVGSIVGIKKPKVGSGGGGSGKTFTADEVRKDLANLVSARQAEVEASVRPQKFAGGSGGIGSWLSMQKYQKHQRYTSGKPMPGIEGAFQQQYLRSIDPYRKVQSSGTGLMGALGGMQDSAGRAFLRKYGFQPDIMRQALEQFDANQAKAAKQQQGGGGALTGAVSPLLDEVTGSDTTQQPGSEGAAPPERIVGDVGTLGVSSGGRRGGRRGRVKTLLSGLGGESERFGG